jgi:uroporphyrinogen III methyltransferase/synthase
MHNAKLLTGRRIVNTRPRQKSARFSEKLRALGADVIELPTIRVEALDDHAIGDAIKRIASYDLLVFTSANAVDVFMHAAAKKGLGPESTRDLKIAAIGPATGEALSHAGLRADLVADEFVAEGMVRKIEYQFGDLRGKRILFPKALKTRDVIKNDLERMGGIVDDIAIYRTVDENRNALSQRCDDLKDPPDVVTFTSSSAVLGFRRIVPEPILQTIRERSVIACIGPVTARTAEAEGFSVRIVPEEHTTDGLVHSIVSYFGNDRPAGVDSRR